jgi:hypothetical protein
MHKLYPPILPMLDGCGGTSGERVQRAYPSKLLIGACRNLGYIHRLQASCGRMSADAKAKRAKQVRETGVTDIVEPGR